MLKLSTLSFRNTEDKDITWMSNAFHLLGQLSGGSQHHCLCSLQIHIDLLQDGNGKRGRLSCARLSLCNDIIPYRQKTAEY